MEHRQEQIKAEEIKLRSMQQQIERLDTDIARYMGEISRLTEENRAQQQKVRMTGA